MAGHSRPPARHAKVPTVAVDHHTSEQITAFRAALPRSQLLRPLNRIVRTLGGGTEGSNPARSSGESDELRYVDRVGLGKPIAVPGRIAAPPDGERPALWGRL